MGTHINTHSNHPTSYGMTGCGQLPTLSLLCVYWWGSFSCDNCLEIDPLVIAVLGFTLPQNNVVQIFVLSPRLTTASSHAFSLSLFLLHHTLCIPFHPPPPPSSDETPQKKDHRRARKLFKSKPKEVWTFMCVCVCVHASEYH